MINNVFFEGRCLVEQRGMTVYNDNARKLPIFVGTFLNMTRKVRICKTFLFFGELAVFAKENFTKNKFFILQASYKKIRGKIFLVDKEDPTVSAYIKGEGLVVYKIYRAFRTYANEETTEIEKSLTQTTTHNLQTRDWQLLARREPLKVLTKDKIKDALRSIGIYEI